jgi:hypothetical protein
MKSGPESHYHKRHLDPLKSELERAGVKYFLQKPYMPDEVVKTLQSLIERES